MDKVLVIVGPTASGKSAFGVECAKAFDGEIISGDSIQIYKGLDIGSAKADMNERGGIVHHLIDVKEPFENYSVLEFQKMGRELIDDIVSRGKLPIVVGGTGLYIKALLYDYVFFVEEEEDEQFDDLSNEELYDILLKEDPDSLKKIHVNNRRRLIRALNVLRKHQRGMADIASMQEHRLLYDVKMVGFNISREELYRRIDERVDFMVQNGLVEEIVSLLKMGVSFDYQSMRAIGYKEFAPFFNNECSLDECISMVKRNTRRFAKRQYTWFNNQMHVDWYDGSKKAMEDIEKWLSI